MTSPDETVPAGIPPAISWDELAAKKNGPPRQLKKAQTDPLLLASALGL
jgi:hypothetical protein